MRSEKWPLLFTELQNICASRGWTLGLAESCTGGLMSAWLTAEAGVSSFYQGGVVSYAREAKIHVLQVSPAAIRAYGEVSEVVARQMAVGARQKLKCDWAVSVTGIAGPSGGSIEKPVGTVCFAVAGPGVLQTITKYFGLASSPLPRQEIQQQAALFAFEFLANAMR
jgi:nicotinamide-nucleotide amidase